MTEPGAEILIVEDSPTQAEQLKYILEHRGYRVSVAADAKKALAAVAKSRPAIIISDIVMPEVDGFELCRRIKTDEGTRDIPVILLTALSDPEDVLRGLECGADNFLTKPYNVDYLIDQIRHILLNEELRSKAGGNGAEVFFKGRKYSITAERQQILDLLFSTYETAVSKNRELKEVQAKLEALNEDLERKVHARTAALIAEIDQRKKVEAEINQLNADLERRIAQRTAQLEETNQDLESFSYSVSHDLKAPLRAIGGLSNILLETHAAELGDESRNLLGMLMKNAIRMGQLIDDILSFSRVGRQELSLTEVRMEELVQSVFEGLRPGIQDREVKLKIKELPRATGDSAAIRQVFQNLLSNALKFTNSRELSIIEVGGYDGGDENVYYVKDNGVGFSGQYADKLFNIFQRLHGADEFEGTGIGLAIVKRFINKLGGRVWAEGSIGAGATFYFSLPK